MRADPVQTLQKAEQLITTALQSFDAKMDGLITENLQRSFHTV